MSALTEQLHKEVYPNLDAAAAGFLDDLSPSPKGGRGNRPYYVCTCPECKVPKRAFYYPGSSDVICNREDDCGQRTRIFDLLEKRMSRKDVVEALFRAANIPLPNGGTPTPPSPERAFTTLLRTTLQGLLLADRAAMNYLRSERGFTDDQIRGLDLGYFPSEAVVRTALTQAGANLQLAVAWGVLKSPDWDKPYWPFDGRIVGFWPQPDGSLRLLGRSLTDGTGPKYYFAEGMVKTVPYGWRGGREVIVVEGMMDQLTLRLFGQNTSAIGGVGVTAAQAAFFAEKGVRQVTHITDDNRAGRRGGVQTVQNCEPLGITTYVATLPQGCTDVDALRKAGNDTGIKQVLASAELGGTYLARIALLGLAMGNPAAVAAMQDLVRERVDLTTASRLAFEHHFHRYGLALGDPATEALKLAARLREAGLPDDVVRDRLRAIHGMTLTLTEIERG